MGQISHRPQFIEDLREVWDFIAKDSQDQADAFIFQLEKRYQNLADNPQLGVRRFPKYPTMRMFQFRKYIIIYDPFADGSGVELIRLRHAARDYHRYFDD